MSKPRDPVAPDPPVKGKEEEEEEDSGDDERSSSEAEEAENEVSEPEPPQNQNSQVMKKPVAAPSGRQPSESQLANSKKPFDRLWSEDDEIVILEGMIDYRAKNKVDPKTDLDGFFEFIKKSVHVDVSKAQLQNKIRTLKRKYEKCKKKVSLKEGHEQIAFDLLKKIWGTKADGVDHNVGSPPKANRIALKKSRDGAAMTNWSGRKDSREDAVEFQRPAKRSRSNGVPQGTFMDGVENLGIENWIEKVGMAVIKGQKREEMDEKWKEFKVQEVEVYVKKLELLIKQTKMILEAMKGSGH